MRLMRSATTWVAAMILLWSPWASTAQTWPTRSVRIIVPAAPGGAYDRDMRALADALGQQLGQQFIIVNKPGAGNITGTQLGASASPDGYTFTAIGMFNSIAQGTYARIPFDIVRDFEHVAPIAGGGQWIVVNRSAGVDTLAGLVEVAKREPDKITYGTSGQGSTGHLLMELLQRTTGMRLTHVPYKGGNEALLGVVRGDIPLAAIPPAGVSQFIANGRLLVLAVSGAHRNTAIPDTPTLQELGYTQLNVTSWIGLAAPKGTPPHIIEAMNTAVRKSLQRTQILRRFEADGAAPMFASPEVFSAFVATETMRWGELVRELGLTAN